MMNRIIQLGDLRTRVTKNVANWADPPGVLCLNIFCFQCLIIYSMSNVYIYIHIAINWYLNFNPAHFCRFPPQVFSQTQVSCSVKKKSTVSRKISSCSERLETQLLNPMMGCLPPINWSRNSGKSTVCRMFSMFVLSTMKNPRCKSPKKPPGFNKPTPSGK